MEKRRPTYDLDAIRRTMGRVATLNMTVRAYSDALALGFDRADVARVMASIDRSMFYKSMTTYADHTAWQDVYHVPANHLVLYVKVGADVVTEFTVVSFKEK